MFKYVGGINKFCLRLKRSKNMIWSRYNEFIQSDNSFFLFNCRTKKWLTFVPELYKLLVNCDNLKEIEQIHPTLFKVLVEHNFLVNNAEREISECTSEIDAKLELSKTLKITINPTLDCNLRCWYCYEGHLKGSVMNPTTIDSVCKYLSKCFEEYDYSKLQLAFFGGEPLLKFDTVVKPLLEQVKLVCEKHHVELAVSFTTNGVLLTQRVRNEITKTTRNVSVQIPFDGDSNSHNQIKKFPNGKGSYELVKKNARESVIDGFRVTVRCNYTKKNIRSFLYVIKDFEDLLSIQNLRFSFHKVWQEVEDDELKSGIKVLKSNLEKFHFTSNIHSYFGDSVNPCYGDYANNYVINYNGDVFKCTARDFKPEHKIGKLSDTGEIEFNAHALQRVRKSRTTECAVCRRLPICPICSQVRAESTDGKCPAHISPDEISQNIRDYFMDLYTQNKVS